MNLRKRQSFLAVRRFGKGANSLVESALRRRAQNLILKRGQSYVDTAARHFVIDVPLQNVDLRQNARLRAVVVERVVNRLNAGVHVAFHILSAVAFFKATDSVQKCAALLRAVSVNFNSGELGIG